LNGYDAPELAMHRILWPTLLALAATLTAIAATRSSEPSAASQPAPPATAAASQPAPQGPTTAPASQPSSQPSTAPAKYPALVAVLETAKGKVRVQLGVNESPRMVAYFVTLAERGVYDNYHVAGGYRNEKVEFGDPKLDALEPGVTVKPRFNPKYSFKGAGDVALFPLREDAVGSKFFITFVYFKNRALSWPLIGRVESGMDVVRELVVGDTIERVRIEGDASALKGDLAAPIADWNKAIDGFLAARAPAG
jgi:peptidyl-prolyl cis-trans isomerase B (cyclophilin B)